MSDPRILTLDEIKGLVGRLSTASGSLKVPRALRTDLVVAALLISTLIKTGAISAPVQLGGRADG